MQSHTHLVDVVDLCHGASLSLPARLKQMKEERYGGKMETYWILKQLKSAEEQALKELLVDYSNKLWTRMLNS